MSRNPYNCECGGLRYKCAQFGHLPGSISHYHAPIRKETHITVVWSGRDELLADRREHVDDRMASMPDFDLDEGEVVEAVKPKRPYNRTGRHVGVFSRTNPDAPYYKPTMRSILGDADALAAAQPTVRSTETPEETHHG